MELWFRRLRYGEQRIRSGAASRGFGEIYNGSGSRGLLLPTSVERKRLWAVLFHSSKRY
jgi:hypothetical protein